MILLRADVAVIEKYIHEHSSECNITLNHADQVSSQSHTTEIDKIADGW